MEKLWTQKYKPTKIEDIIGNKNQIKKIIEWIKLVKMKKAKKYILLIHGPPGIGKTTIINIILKEFNFNIIEFNSSDLRKQKNIRNVISKVLYYKNVMSLLNGINKESALILDEFDSMFSSSDKGGSNELLNIIKESHDTKNKSRIIITNPIICIYNDFNDKKLNEFKKFSIDIKFNKPTFFDLELIINKIIIKEKINIDIESKHKIINNSLSDIRRMIILLRDLTIKKNKNNIINIKKEDISIQEKIFDKKNINFMVFDIIKLILNKKSNIDTIDLYHSSDIFIIPLLIHENYPHILFNKLDNINIKKCSLCKISKYLCLNNLIENLIKERNMWNLLYFSSFYSSYLTNYELNKLEKNKYSKIEVNSSVLLNKISNKYLQIYYNYNKNTNIFNLNSNYNFNISDIIHLSKIFNYIIYSKNNNIFNLKYYIDFYNFSLDDILFIIKQKSEKKITKKITKSIQDLIDN